MLPWTEMSEYFMWLIDVIGHKKGCVWVDFLGLVNYDTEWLMSRALIMLANSSINKTREKNKFHFNPLISIFLFTQELFAFNLSFKFQAE
jgi:hypothetical protein